MLAKWLGITTKQGVADAKKVTCLPLFDGEQPNPEANKVNVIVRFVGSLHLTEARAKIALLKSYTPFAEPENEGKLQFWYVQDPSSLAPATSSAEICPCEEAPACDDPPLPNATYIDLRDDQCRATAKFGGKVCLSLKGIPSDTSNDDRVLSHEFGHAFGSLKDEYADASTGKDEPGWPNCAPASMFPAQTNQSPGAYCLQALPSLRKTWWSPLLPSNLEAVCQSGNVPEVFGSFGCSYTDRNVRPTDHSLMNDHRMNDAAPPDGFQPVNIRWLRMLLAPFDNAPLSTTLPSAARALVATLRTAEPTPALCPTGGETALRIHLQRSSEAFAVTSTETFALPFCVPPKMLFSGLAVRIRIGDKTYAQTVGTDTISIAEDFSQKQTHLVQYDKVPESALTVDIGLGTTRIDGNEAVLQDGTRLPYSISIEACGEGSEPSCPAPMIAGTELRFCTDGSLDRGNCSSPPAAQKSSTMSASSQPNVQPAPSSVTSAPTVSTIVATIVLSLVLVVGTIVTIAYVRR